MASVTLSPVTGWTVGETISAYVRNQRNEKVGSAVATATVASDSTTTFTGLDAETRFIATDGTSEVRFGTHTDPESAQSGSGLPANILTKTANFTAAAGDFILADATAGTFQVTLPAGTAGQLITVKKVDGGANPVAVDVTGGGTIDGDAGGASITSPQFGGIFECSSPGAWQLVSPLSPGGSNGTDGTDGATGATGAAGADGQTTVTANAQTTDYTLVIGDAGKSIDVAAAAGKAVTFPPNSSVAFPLGTIVEVAQLGSAAVTLTAGVGVTLNSAGGLLATRAQYSVASARKIATNTWLVSGDLA